MLARVYQLRPQEKEPERPKTTAKIIDITPRIRKRSSAKRRANYGMILVILALLTIIVGALWNARN